MYVNYDEDEYEAVKISDPVVCSFHMLNPGKSHPNIAMQHGACGCQMARFGQRRRTHQEIAAIKAERLKRHEDEILRQADLIKHRRTT